MDETPQSPKQSPTSAGRLGLVTAIVIALVVAVVLVRKRAPESTASPSSTAALTVKERYKDISKPSVDPALGRELIPNAGTGTKIVNDLGYIGQRYPKERSPKTFRIVGLGDANSMYYGAEGQNYLSALKKGLSGTGVEVLNFAVDGDGLKSEVRRLETAALAYKPDLVVIGFSVDDVVDLKGALSDAAGKPVSDPFSPEGLAATNALFKHLGTSSQTKQEFYDKIFASPAWRDSVMALLELGRLAEANHLKVVIATLPALVHFEPYQFQPLHDAIRVQVERHHFGYLDLTSTFAKETDFAKLRESEDPFTYSPTAHEKVGAALREYLLRDHFLPDEFRVTAEAK